MIMSSFRHLIFWKATEDQYKVSIYWSRSCSPQWRIKRFLWKKVEYSSDYNANIHRHPVLSSIVLWAAKHSLITDLQQPLVGKDPFSAVRSWVLTIRLFSFDSQTCRCFNNYFSDLLQSGNFVLLCAPLQSKLKFKKSWTSLKMTGQSMTM